MRIVKVTSEAVSVTWDFIGEWSGDWTVSRAEPGMIGSMTAHQGERQCSIGRHVTKDGTEMQPDYRKLRKLCFGQDR